MPGSQQNQRGFYWRRKKPIEVGIVFVLKGRGFSRAD
jgi:hypothetical protein